MKSTVQNSKVDTILTELKKDRESLQEIYDKRGFPDLSEIMIPIDNFKAIHGHGVLLGYKFFLDKLEQFYGIQSVAENT